MDKENININGTEENKSLRKVENKKERKTISEKTKNIIFGITVFVCVCLYSLAISPKTLQNDTFYTIKVGEYICQNEFWNFSKNTSLSDFIESYKLFKQDLTEDVFSWQDLPYTYPHWLYDIFIYKIYNSFGQDGIYASTIIFTALLGYSIYLNSCNKSDKKLISFILSMIGMYLLRDYVAARAQLITYCLFSFTVLFIEKFLSTHKKRYAVFLFIIPILITNLHCAVFPFYFVLFLPYIAEYLWILILDNNLDYKVLKIVLKIIMKFVPSDKTYEKLQSKIDNIPNAIEREKESRDEKRKNSYKVELVKNPYVKWLIVIFIITAFTGFLNPCGTGAYTYTYKIYQGNTTASINEHQPLTLIDYKEYMIGLAIFLAILILTKVKIKLSDLFMTAGLVFLSLKSRRQFAMVLIFCIPILVKLISDFIEIYDKKTYKKIFDLYRTYIGSLITILCFSIFVTTKIDSVKYSDYIDSSSYPVSAADWILKNLDVNTIKIYNEYNYGSYLLFRGIPVFIDSRCDLYTPEFNGYQDIFSDALNTASLSNNYKNIFKDYGFTHLVIPSNAKILLLLDNDANIKKIYHDSSFSVYEVLESESTTNSTEVTEENNDDNNEDDVINIEDLIEKR